MQQIQEHSTKIKVSIPKKDVNAKMSVFYNPIMKSNRNISILLLNATSNKNMKVALPLAGSGIRGLRFIKELKKGKMKELFVNDKKDNFIDVFEANLTKNNISSSNRITIKKEDAAKFMLDESGFDYIDIDPFGTPNPFLGATIARISRNGIIAVTATDTAALTGTYPKVTKRKYWARSLKNYMMHETGLRILIRKIQLQGIQFDKALTPILAYHKDHYFRIYFKSEKSKTKCDETIKNHQYLLFCPKCLNFKVSNYNCGVCKCKSKFDYAGPLWTGKLFDSKLLKKMVKNNPYDEDKKFLNLLVKESGIDVVGFHDLHVIAKKSKKEPPRMDVALKKMKGVRTHFGLYGIKVKK